MLGSSVSADTGQRGQAIIGRMNGAARTGWPRCTNMRGAPVSRSRRYGLPAECCCPRPAARCTPAY